MIKAGILNYGIYIPFYRLKVDEIASVWGKDPKDISKSLGVNEKSVSGLDEDSVTMAYEASYNALKNAKIKSSQIETILVGSESHPYAVNPTSTILGEFLGVGEKYLAADLQFACKAASTAIIAVAGLITAKIIKTGLIVGSDRAQAKPHDVLEYSSASGAAAFILSDDTASCIAEIEAVNSISSDTPDFWRRDGVRFPTHSGRFTGEPAYFHHVSQSVKGLLDKTDYKPGSFKYCVFHMPNGKFPRIIAKRLGFSNDQISPSLIVDDIGNPYSASSLLGLSAVLDNVQKGDRILYASYGSGAGSDSLILKVTRTHKSQGDTYKSLVARKKYIKYVDYLKFTQKI